MRQFLRENILTSCLDTNLLSPPFTLYQIYWYLILISKDYFYSIVNIGEHDVSEQSHVKS